MVTQPLLTELYHPPKMRLVTEPFCEPAMATVLCSQSESKASLERGNIILDITDMWISKDSWVRDQQHPSCQA